MLLFRALLPRYDPKTSGTSRYQVKVLIMPTMVIRLTIVAVVAVLLALSLGAVAQDATQRSEVTRDLWDSNLLSKRPPGKQKRSATSQDDALVGVTLWKLRPSRSIDNPAVRSLIHENETREWTPERISVDTALNEGDRVRISIESARTGYLYVIDSDEYSDGSRGDPYLIFPTFRIRNGDNVVGAGTVIEIPAPEDAPSYFRMRRSRPDQRAEVLSILVSPKPIEELKIGKDRVRLTATQLASWKSRWGNLSRKLESKDAAGATYTPAEKAAGSARKKLTGDDPLPQTMYHVNAKMGDALMIELPLQVAK